MPLLVFHFGKNLNQPLWRVFTHNTGVSNSPATKNGVHLIDNQYFIFKNLP
jgi:hypothetical protein